MHDFTQLDSSDDEDERTMRRMHRIRLVKGKKNLYDFTGPDGRYEQERDKDGKEILVMSKAQSLRKAMSGRSCTPGIPSYQSRAMASTCWVS